LPRSVVRDTLEEVRGVAQTQAPPRGERPSGSGAGSGLGMRRVSWVRVVVGDGGEAVCHVMGIGHRLPTARRVPLATALALASEGVPCVLRGDSHAPRPARPSAAR
jgi:hypothetical protein